MMLYSFVASAARQKILARSIAPCIERLEGRRLFTAFAADINFEPASVAPPAGFLADNGAVYGDRGNGLSYGWNAPHPAQVTARKLKAPTDGADALYDTLATMHFKGRGSQWQIAVPDGNYDLSITAGDVKGTGRDTLDVNGVLFLDGKGTRKSRWVSCSAQIAVTDGFITLTVPKGRTAKVDFLAISQIVAAPNPLPPAPGEAPYTGTPFSPSQVIPADEYDTGGEGVGYHDTTPTNLGNSNFRPGDAVDLYTGGTSGSVVGSTAAGEWLNYTINIATAGMFTLNTSVANDAAGGSFHAEVNGVNLTGSLTAPNTTDLTSFQTVSSPAFALSAGTQVLHISFDTTASNQSAGNFDWFEILPAPSPPPVIAPLVWSTKANAPIGEFEAHGTAVDGKLYVFGGFDADTPEFQSTNAAEAYDPATNTWATLAPMPVRESHTAVATDGTDIYVAGGYPYNPQTTFQTFGTTDVLRYDIATNSWSFFVPLPSPRGGGELDYLDGQLHYFDGLDGVDNPQHNKIPEGTHWMLDLSSPNPQWVTAAPVPLPRNHLASVVLDGKIYAMGGRATGQDTVDPTADCLVWDPANPNVWTSIASLPQIRAVSTAAVFDGEIYLIGGTTAGYKIIASVDVYDPATNTWSAQTSIPEGRFAPVAGVVGNTLIVTTGFSFADNGIFETTTWTATLG